MNNVIEELRLLVRHLPDEAVLIPVVRNVDSVDSELKCRAAAQA